MQTAKDIRRQILTYSLVGQGLGGNGDPIAALQPFLSPIASDLNGQVFDLSTFRAELKARYGIRLTRDVTEVFLQRLIALGLVRARDRNTHIWHRPAVVTVAPDTASERIDGLCAAARALHAQRHDLLNGVFDEDEFLNALMSVLLNQNRSLANTVASIEPYANGGVPPSVAPEAPPATAYGQDEYFASEFIRWTADNRKDIFRWLADLSGTALVAEALIGVRTPKPNQTIRVDVTVYLDSPFLMELLGCSGQSARDDAKYIVDTLQSQRIPVAVFAHSVGELQSNLKGVLLAHPQARTGPSAKALLFHEVTEAYLQSVRATPEHYIEQLHIAIIDPVKLGHLPQDPLFNEDKEQSFYATIYGLHENEPARNRDVASIAWVMRRRRGEVSRDLLKSKHILLTRYGSLARVANKFAIDHCGYSRASTGPVTLARDLAGILWLIVGQSERHELSQRQLILGCDRARSAAPDVIAAMFSALENADPKNAELLWAAVQKPAYLSMALDAVASNGGVVTEANLEQVLTAIRADLVADERQRSADKLKRTKQQSDAEAELNRLVNESLEREKSELAQKNADMLDRFRAVSEQYWSRNRELAQNSLNAAQITLNVGLVALIALGAVLGTDAVSWAWYWKAIIGAVLGVTGLYLSQSYVVEFLNDKIGSIFQLRYDKMLRVIAGKYYDDVVIRDPVFPPPK